VVSVPGSKLSWTQNPDVLEVLHNLRKEESLIVLARRNDEAKAIARLADLGLVVNEGSDVSAVEQVVAEVASVIGDEHAVATAMVDFMIGCGSLAAQTADLIRALDHNRADHRTAEVIGYLQAAPNLPGLVRAIRIARRHAHELGWTISHPTSVSTLALLPISIGVEEVRDLVFQAQRAANEAAMPVRSASTIHKAKGREFDHVVLPWVDASTFSSDIKDRHLLYVALSRARRRLTLIVPTVSLSPLFAQ
jgi:DNA helicase-2/ATP-dependent DNA helicase PcrA